MERRTFVSQDSVQTAAKSCHSRSNLYIAAGGARLADRDHPKRCLNKATRWFLNPCFITSDAVLRAHMHYTHTQR